MTTCIAPGCKSPREVGALFCAVHLRAPAGHRGGWISADLRRRRRGASVDVPLDASNIARRLWVGSQPPFDRHLPDFDVLVLCAKEIQPARVAFQGQVIRCPIDDAILDRAEVSRVLAAAKTVAHDLASGKRVLVTCHMGWNRSALVAALSLGLVTRLSAAELVERMRARRSPQALGNPHFVKLLHQYIGAGRGRPSPTST